MIEIAFSPSWLYIASFYQDVGDKGYPESGVSVIILGLRVTVFDRVPNPRRKEWVIPRNAWDGKNSSGLTQREPDACPECGEEYSGACGKCAVGHERG